jgi:hypothetical protein
METAMDTWLLKACPVALLSGRALDAPSTFRAASASISRAHASPAAGIETVAGNSVMYLAITAICVAAPVLIIGLVAVFRADPKDLPAVLDSLGKWARRRSK